jgi:hypothetical protein
MTFCASHLNLKKSSTVSTNTIFLNQNQLEYLRHILVQKPVNTGCQINQTKFGGHLAPENSY